MMKNESGENKIADEETMRILHIYSPASQHDAAYIVGNREGLQSLREAIDSVLDGKEERAISETVFLGDGEGYEICVAREDLDFTDSFWGILSLPYFLAEAQGRENYRELLEQEDIIYPYTLFRSEEPEE